MPECIDADVCVVGAGHAGPTAARQLSQAGRSVAVLETRDRVGGRIRTPVDGAVRSGQLAAAEILDRS